MMDRRLSIVLCIALLCGSVPSVSAEKPPFPDMKNSWFDSMRSVSYLRERDAINGYPDGTFRPLATINRAEFLKLVFRAKTDAEPLSGDCFLDVKVDAWYAPFVCAAARRGIVKGYPSFGGNVFRPEQPVTFSEAMKILLLAYDKDISEDRLLPGEEWYDRYALELDRSHVLARSSYIPWDPLTRERAADMIAHFLQHEQDHIVPSNSRGCGQPTPEPLTGIRSGGAERPVTLTVPIGYKPDQPTPLIVVFYGRLGITDELKSHIGIDQQAKGYLVAYPSAIRSAQGTFSWGVPYFDDVVEAVSNLYCVDMDRIFVAGYSDGAVMANTIACQRGGHVRASATVAGDSILTDCPGPSAALLIHNPHDEMIPFSRGEQTRDLRIKENGCQLQTDAVQPESLKCLEYQGCDGGNVVHWCPHQQDNDTRGVFYPSNWPQQAPAAIVDFFDGLK